jgi:hypothetical protein
MYNLCSHTYENSTTNSNHCPSNCFGGVFLLLFRICQGASSCGISCRVAANTCSADTRAVCIRSRTMPRYRHFLAFVPTSAYSANPRRLVVFVSLTHTLVANPRTCPHTRTLSGSNSIPFLSCKSHLYPSVSRTRRPTPHSCAQYHCLISAGFDHDALIFNPYYAQCIGRLRGHRDSLVRVQTVPGTPQVITADVTGA